MTSETPDLSTANVQHLISLIYADWDNVDSSAHAYLHAVDLSNCHDLDNPVGDETADIQMRHFLTHAAGWRGPTARAVKAELRRRLGL
jgi:hypothetical protein